jgi:hypothetical protein
MQEYERTITTVANSYVRPKVAAYVKSLERKLKAKMKDVKLHILRSDGGHGLCQGRSIPASESVDVRTRWWCIRRRLGRQTGGF